jgi:hypothetical protein
MYPFIPTSTSDMRLATCQPQRPQHRHLDCRLRIHRVVMRRDGDLLPALHYQPKKPTSVLSGVVPTISGFLTPISESAQTRTTTVILAVLYYAVSR